VEKQEEMEYEHGRQELNFWEKKETTKCLGKKVTGLEGT
jgi:hypothetical protein